jgi:ATP-binding cassette subfamily B protein
VVRFVVDCVVGDVSASEMPLVASLTRFALSASGASARRLFCGLFVVGIAVFGGVCDYVYRRALALGAEGIVKRLRDRLYDHILHLPYEWHLEIKTGDIIQRCTSDVEIVRSFVFVQLIEIVRAVALVTFAYAILFPMNRAMAAASFAFLPVIFVYSFVFLRRASVRFLAADEAEGDLLAIAQENFTGVRVVRAFGQERFEVDRFRAQNDHFAELWIKLGQMLSTYWGLGDFLTGMQMVVICAFGAYQASLGLLTVGDFFVFINYNAMIIWPIRGLGRVLSEASKTGVSLGRIVEILRAPRETDPPDALGALETPVRCDIVFDRVTFSYGSNVVLDDVSFTVPEGATLGILGATGSGKTTIAHLICRLYDLRPGQGEICVGGVNVNRYTRAWLRRNVGIVLQEPFLYSRTIGENIASLARDSTLGEIRAAASIAQIDEAIERFADGFDTIVGERGVTLSGGQKQRVAIARAVLKRPPIMIFDDSLSAVDTETDARIRGALKSRTAGVTAIVIAHRITSVSNADRIVVMEGGRVAEQGTPAELLARGGIYRRIHDLQRSVEEELTDACAGGEEGD